MLDRRIMVFAIFYSFFRITLLKAFCCSFYGYELRLLCNPKIRGLRVTGDNQAIFYLNEFDRDLHILYFYVLSQKSLLVSFVASYFSGIGVIALCCCHRFGWLHETS